VQLPQSKKKIALYFLPIFAILAFFYSYVVASVKYYPTDQWQYSAPEAQGMTSTSLLEMMEDIKKNKYNIQSISIVRNGYLVLDAYINFTENEGIAKDGMFKRAASPSFQFEYPLGCIKTATRQPDQIMRMETPAGGIITASTDAMPRDRRRFYFSMKLEDFGPKAYASWMKEYGSNITVLSNEEITLSCGTKAYRTDIKWLLKNCTPLTTNLVSTYKDDRSIYIAVHQFKKSSIVETIIESLRFE